MRNLKFLALLVLVAILSPIVWSWLKPRLFPPTEGPRQTSKGDPDNPAGENRRSGDPPDDVAPPLRSPLFRGVEQALESSPALEGQEERDRLIEQLEEADGIFSRIKEENRRALARLRTPILSRPATRLRRAPNILVFDIGALRASDLGCYGRSEYRTPIIDLLAAQGVRFEAFYRRPPACSLLTGWLDQREAASDNGDAATALPGLLGKAGYATSSIGVCDFRPRQNPAELGFQDWFGSTTPAEFQRQFPEQLHSQEGAVRLLANLEGDDRQDAIQVFVSETISFLESQSADKPFFLYVHWPLPETGWRPPQRWRSDSGEFAGNLRHVDHELGRVIKRMNELRLSENSLFLITSLRRPKAASLRESNLRAPLVIVGPGRVRKGVVSRHVCEAADLFPSILELSTLVPARPETSATSLTPELVGKPQPTHDFLAWDNAEGDRALRTGKWKGVLRSGASKLELYDLEADAIEQDNVAGSHPVEVARIKQYLAEAFEE